MSKVIMRIDFSFLVWILMLTVIRLNFKIVLFSLTKDLHFFFFLQETAFLSQIDLNLYIFQHANWFTLPEWQQVINTEIFVHIKLWQNSS